MTTRHVAVLVGSLRRESLNRKMARAMAEIAGSTLELGIVEIGNLPLYNDDLEKDVPEAWATFRDTVRRADAALFVTPEYNRTIPGVLKNAIDVGSRPYGKSVWSKKPAAIISVTPGAMGGFGANHCVRQSLVFLDMPAMQQPEAYLGGADKLFDASGKLTSDTTRDFLKKFTDAFASWIDKHLPR